MWNQFMPWFNRQVRVWFPAAHSNDYQEVRIVSAKGDLPLKR